MQAALKPLRLVKTEPAGELDCNSVTLEKDLGETRISGLDKLDLPDWRWASR